MSKKPELIRSFNFSDGSLIQLADKVILNGTRDDVELIPEGVTAQRLTDLGALNDTFRNMEDDVEWAGLVSEKAEIKDAALEVCETQTRNIRRMAANIFGEGSTKYKRFGFDGINALKDVERIKAYYRIVRRANQRLADLAPEGLTAGLITTYTAACAAADVAYDVLVDTIEDRDEATENRIELANEIYAEVVKICNTGKTYWFDRSEAKYNDYVITPSGTTQTDESSSMKFNGLVTDMFGNPVVGAIIRASNAEGSISTTTGVAGLYSLQITGLTEPANATLSAEFPGLATQLRAVTAVGGVNQEQNFQLSPEPTPPMP
jgi:hypothetical protein